MSFPDDRQLGRIVRFHRTLWYVFLTTPILYLVVAYFLTQNRADGWVPISHVGTIRVAFLVLAVVCFFGAFWIRRFLLGRTLVGSGSPAARIQTALVAGWAMIETIALLGLVLVILGNPLRDAIGFALVAFVGLLRMRPSSPEQLREAFRTRS